MENSDAASLASGALEGLPIGPNDYRVAPLAQSGVTPWSRRPALMQKLIAGGEAAATLPNAFAMPLVSAVSFKGYACTLEARVVFVFDARKALDAREQLGAKANVLLASKEAGVGLSLSKKDLGVKLGTRVGEKIEVIFTEVAKAMDFAAVAPVFNVQMSNFGASLRSEFAPGNAFYLDLPATLAKTALVVSRAFLERHLCGGKSHYSRPPTQAPLVEVPLPNGVERVNDIGHGFRELTSQTGFDLDHLQPPHLAVPAGYALQFRVVFPGSFDALAANKALASEPSVAEAHLEAVASDTCGGNVGALLHSGAVYAVLIKM